MIEKGTRGYDNIAEFVRTDLSQKFDLGTPVLKEAITNAINLFDDIYKKQSNGDGLSTVAKTQMFALMEYEFEILETPGDAVLILDSLRQSKWWTDSMERREQEKRNYYAASFKKYMRKKGEMREQTIVEIENRSDKILDYLFDPSNPDITEVHRFGMVMGHVQAGKTSNYAVLINKAADAGFKIIIVLAGLTKILRQQTQDRLNKDFVGEDESHLRIGVGNYRAKNGFDKKRPISLTLHDNDFLAGSQRATSMFNLDNTSAPYLLVVKKNARVLYEILNWIGNKDTKEHSLLIIDDEADNASVSTRTDDLNPTVINQRIREILQKFKKSAYIGYTATPFANIFINPNGATAENPYGDDLYPKDFIVSIEPPAEYIGAEKIFAMTDEGGDSPYLVPIDDWQEVFPEKQSTSSIDEYANEIPDSLKKAIYLFLLNIAARNIRNSPLPAHHNSMLIHVSRLTEMHKKVKTLVKDFVDELSAAIRNYAGLPETTQEWVDNIQPIKEVFLEVSENGWGQNSRYGTLENWSALLGELQTICTKVQVGAAYTGTQDIHYSDTEPTYIIAVGGASLARGFTLENLSVSYFIRNTVTCDTLLQMGRWFGYRPYYDDLCRIFMPAEYIENFRHATQSSSSLMNAIKGMEKNRRNPIDFLIQVQEHPASLLTAKNKSRNASRNVGFRLDGELTEDGNIDPDGKYAESLDVVRILLAALGSPDSGDSETKGYYFWKNRNYGPIEDFVRKNPTPVGMYDKNLFAEYIHLNEHITWDVVLHGKTKGNSEGAKPEKFGNLNLYKITRNYRANKAHFVSVSAPPDERIGLSETQIFDAAGKPFSREKVRENRGRALLIIHIADIYAKNESGERGLPDKVSVPLFTVSFPGTKSDPKTQGMLGLVWNARLKELLAASHTDADDDGITDEDLND